MLATSWASLAAWTPGTVFDSGCFVRRPRCTHLASLGSNYGVFWFNFVSPSKAYNVLTDQEKRLNRKTDHGDV